MQIFYIISLNLPRSFLRPDVFIKKYGFLCIRFRGPRLSQLLVYLILQSFKNIPKFKSMCLCVCVCVCAYVFVCINVTSQNNLIVATWKNTKLRITFRNVKKFQKFINWKLKKMYHLYKIQNFTCLKCCYISLSIKKLYTLKQSWKRVIICIFF